MYRPSKREFRYAAGKWSVKEVLGHVNDTERIMSYRALRIARGDQTPIEGYEQDDYVAGGKFDRRTMDDLLEEFTTIRNATIQLFRHLDAEAATAPRHRQSRSRSAPAPSPTSSPDTNCITGGFLQEKYLEVRHFVIRSLCTLKPLQVEAGKCNQMLND